MTLADLHVFQDDPAHSVRPPLPRLRRAVVGQIAGYVLCDGEIVTTVETQQTVEVRTGRCTRCAYVSILTIPLADRPRERGRLRAPQELGEP